MPRASSAEIRDGLAVLLQQEFPIANDKAVDYERRVIALLKQSIDVRADVAKKLWFKKMIREAYEKHLNVDSTVMNTMTRVKLYIL